MECYTLLKFDFNFESLSVTLYNSGMTQVCDKAFTTQVGWVAKASHMDRTQVRKMKFYQLHWLCNGFLIELWEEAMCISESHTKNIAKSPKPPSIWFGHSNFDSSYPLKWIFEKQELLPQTVLVLCMVPLELLSRFKLYMAHNFLLYISEYEQSWASSLCWKQKRKMWNAVLFSWLNKVCFV